MSPPALLMVLMAGLLVALSSLAYASPPDPSWIAGIYDDADLDDVVGLVTSATAIVGRAGSVALHVIPPATTPPALRVDTQPSRLSTTRMWIEEEQNMISMRTSVVIIVMVAAILGRTLLPSGVARAAKADDPATFGDNPAIMEQDRKLAERLFHVEWTAREGRSGMSRITGYVYNDYGQAAEDIELLITGLDSAGQPVNTAIEHVSDTVPSRGRGYFDVQIPESSSYRVDVESFEFMEGTGAN